MAALLLLSGCSVGQVADSPAPPSPVASPTNEPVTEPETNSTVTTAVIFGTRVEFRNSAGDVVDTVRYEVGASEFQSKVEAHFGPVDEFGVDERGCSWWKYADGFLFEHQAGWPVEIGVHARELNGIRMETPSGLSFGEDAWELIEATDPELKFDFGSGHPDGSYPYWAVIFDAVGTWGEGTPEPLRYGARALIEDGKLVSVMVPGSLGSMHLSC